MQLTLTYKIMVLIKLFGMTKHEALQISHKYFGTLVQKGDNFRHEY